MLFGGRNIKIVNKKLWQEFQQPGRCEYCGLQCSKREPHHYLSRTPEITVRINLLSVGSTELFQCECHNKIHAGTITRDQVLAKIAARETVDPEVIKEVLLMFRRLVKTTEKELGLELSFLSFDARLLAERELHEAGIIG